MQILQSYSVDLPLSSLLFVITIHCNGSLSLFTADRTITSWLCLGQTVVRFRSMLTNVIISIGYILPILGESDHSPSTLQLRELFSFAEISNLPLQSLSLSDETKVDTDTSELLEQWTTELTGLTESLFSTLSTTEMVFKTVLACQTENPAIDEREMTLIKSESKISLSNIKSGSARELLKVDLELINAMQESLKDSKYAKHMEHRNPKFNAKQLYVELGEESRQIKYWASKLEGSGEQPMTTETQTAMMLNLARIARVFGELNAQ